MPAPAVPWAGDKISCGREGHCSGRLHTLNADWRKEGDEHKHGKRQSKHMGAHILNKGGPEYQRQTQMWECASAGGSVRAPALAGAAGEWGNCASTGTPTSLHNEEWHGRGGPLGSILHPHDSGAGAARLAQPPGTTSRVGTQREKTAGGGLRQHKSFVSVWSRHAYQQRACIRSKGRDSGAGRTKRSLAALDRTAQGRGERAKIVHSGGRAGGQADRPTSVGTPVRGLRLAAGDHLWTT